MSDAKVIPLFPAVAQWPQPEEPPVDDAFERWVEDSVWPLRHDVDELESLASQSDKSDFWAYARSVREAVNAWPIPEDG